MSSVKEFLKILSLQQVDYSFGSQPFIKSLDLDLQQGKFYGILGSNGAGKSTLLHLLTGVNRPTSGRVLWCGKSLHQFSKRELACQFAVVPQDYQINFPYRVIEVVLMGRQPHLGRFGRPTEHDLQKVFHAMERAEILQFAEQPITQLSGGERQRVIFARALAQEPTVLFLDEATSNLDIKHKISLLSTVRRLNQEAGLTVIAVLHDLNLAAMYCDELILMKQGAIYAQGKNEEVLNRSMIRSVFDVDVELYTHPVNGKLQIAIA